MPAQATKTLDDLPALLAPFVGARLRNDRDADGNLVPQPKSIDVWTGKHRRINADIRAITAEGVKFVWDCQPETVPLSAITKVRIVDNDARGFWRADGGTVFEIVPPMRRAA